MFQFTTTNVINSAYAVDGDGLPLVLNDGVTKVDKFKSDATKLFVAKVNTFKKANITSIHKRGYTPGVLETATITVPAVAAGGIVVGNAIRLVANVRLSHNTMSKYTNADIDFQEPTTVEVIAVADPTVNAAALVKALNDIKTQYGYSYFYASSAGAVITLKAREFAQRLGNTILSAEQTVSVSFINPAYVKVATAVVTINGKEGFGDDNWMMRSVMLPTAENVRVFGMSKDERPIMGGNYTQYIIRYTITPDGQDGIVSGNQSITTHIFWVLGTLVAAFDAVLEVVGVPVLSASGTGKLVITGDDFLNVGDSFTATVAGGKAPISYVSSTPGIASAGAATGLVTAVAIGTTTVTATDADGATGTLLVTVIA